MTLFLSAACNEKVSDKQPLEKEDARYAVAILPTPVLSTPDFSSVFGGNDGQTLKLNKKNLISEVEFIALPKTTFTIEERIKKDSHEILRVNTEDYPYPTQKGYYIDSRFVEKRIEKPSGRVKTLPDKDTIINRMLSAKGAIYIWGGNYVKGIPEMLEFYKPSTGLSENVKTGWMLKGVDCSGLLYEAAEGYIPRNTDSLFYFGQPVDIKGLQADAISAKLKPLDIIVYKRHVIIVLSATEAIESAVTEGVKTRNLKGVIRALCKKMRPVNDYEKEGGRDKFVIRRWYPD